MIKKFGIRRIVQILVLLAIAVALGLYNFYVAGPQQRKILQELGTVQAEKDTVTQELTALTSDMESFSLRRLEFKSLTDAGFIDDITEAEMQAYLARIKAKSGIREMTPQFRPAVTQPLHKLLDERYALQRRPMTIDLSAFDDVDIYRFIYYLTFGAPGKVTMLNLFVDRTSEVTPEILTQIEGGEFPVMIRAKIELEWWFMAPLTEEPLPDLNALQTSAVPAADPADVPAAPVDDAGPAIDTSAIPAVEGAAP